MNLSKASKMFSKALRQQVQFLVTKKVVPQQGPNLTNVVDACIIKSRIGKGDMQKNSIHLNGLYDVFSSVMQSKKILLQEPKTTTTMSPCQSLFKLKLSIERELNIQPKQVVHINHITPKSVNISNNSVEIPSDVQYVRKKAACVINKSILTSEKLLTYKNPIKTPPTMYNFEQNPKKSSNQLQSSSAKNNKAISEQLTLNGLVNEERVHKQKPQPSIEDIVVLTQVPTETPLSAEKEVNYENQEIKPTRMQAKLLREDSILRKLLSKDLSNEREEPIIKALPNRDTSKAIKDEKNQNTMSIDQPSTSGSALQSVKKEIDSESPIPQETENETSDGELMENLTNNRKGFKYEKDQGWFPSKKPKYMSRVQRLKRRSSTFQDYLAGNGILSSSNKLTEQIRMESVRVLVKRLTKKELLAFKIGSPKRSPRKRIAK